jgi:polyketide synthase PksJ
MPIYNEQLNNGQKIPLSFPQQRIWFLQNLYNDHVMYNTLRCFRIKGLLDMEALQMTLHTLVARHDALRSRLHLFQDGSPYQVMEKEPEITIEYTDLRNTSGEDIRGLAEQILQEAVVRPFKLYDEKLFRVVIVSLDESESMLLCIMHHLITDFSAWRLFLSEFATVYTAKIMGQQLSLPPLAWQYSDFAKNQVLLHTEENIVSQRKYWRNYFAGCANPPQALCSPSQPLTNTEPPSYEAAWQLIPSDTVRECKMIAESQNCTLFIVVLTVIALLVSYLYRNSKVMLCIANANRQLPGAKQVVGCFFTNIIISLDIRPDLKLFDLIQDIKEMFLHARQNQDMPFELFAEDLALECTLQRKPPYRIYISYNLSAHDFEFSMPNVSIDPLDFSTGRNTHEDIVFNIREKMSEGGICLDIGWLWRNDLFNNKTIKRASSMLEILFGEIRRDINSNVKSLYDSLAGLN